MDRVERGVAATERRVARGGGGAEPSAEDWDRLARVVAKLLAGSWEREQAALEDGRRGSVGRRSPG